MNKSVGTLLLLTLLASCSLVSIDSKTRYRDASGFFDPHLLDQIQPDETTGDWLYQHFGDPLFVDRHYMNPMAAAEQVQISTWRFVRHRQKNTRVFLLFSSRNRHEESEYLHVVLADNRVVKAWRNHIETVDARRVMGVLGYKPVKESAAPVAAAESLPDQLPAVEMQTQTDVEKNSVAVPPAAALEVRDVEETVHENEKLEPVSEPDSPDIEPMESASPD